MTSTLTVLSLVAQTTLPCIDLMALMMGKVEGVVEEGGGVEREREEKDGRRESLVVPWRNGVVGLDEERGGLRREKVRDIVGNLD